MINKISAFIQAKPLRASFLLTLVFFGVYALFLNPAYTSNDDAYFSMAISGFFTGTPIPDIIVFNIILSNTWVALYQWVPDANWYFWVQVACLYTSLSVITYVLLKLKPSFAYLFIPLQVAITAVSLSYVQYTSTAIYLMAAGYTLLLFNFLSRKSWISLGTAIGLIIIGSFFRWFVFQAGLAITLPILLFLIWQKRIQVKRVLIPYALIVLIYLGTQAIHRNYYNTDKQAITTTEYYKNAEELVNNPLKVEEGVLTKAGWKGTDWTMFDAWFAIDNEVFTWESVVYINTQAAKNIDVKRAGSILLKGFKADYLPYLFLGVLFILIVTSSGKLQLYDVLLAGLYLCLAVALVLLARYRFYVFFPLAYFILILQLLLKSGKHLNLILKGVPLLLALSSIVYISINRKVNYIPEQHFYTYLQKFDKNKVYVLMAHGNEVFSDFFSNKPTVSPAKFNGQNFIPLGSLSTMPIYDKLMKKHGITNLSDDLINSDTIYLCDEYDVAFEAYINHINSHYNKQVTIDSIGAVIETPIYRVVSK